MTDGIILDPNKDKILRYTQTRTTVGTGAVLQLARNPPQKNHVTVVRSCTLAEKSYESQHYRHKLP